MYPTMYLLYSSPTWIKIGLQNQRSDRLGGKRSREPYPTVSNTAERKLAAQELEQAALSGKGC